jgi:hypothetical protein
MLWHLWKHRNVCVFEGMSPSVPRIILDISSDADMWCMAGAKGLSSLDLGRVTSEVSNQFMYPPPFEQFALVYFGPHSS